MRQVSDIMTAVQSEAETSPNIVSIIAALTDYAPNVNLSLGDLVRELRAPDGYIQRGVQEFLLQLFEVLLNFHGLSGDASLLYFL